MPQMKIDDQSFEFESGETVIEVATRNNIEIPHYCWHPRLSVAANCRMCLVEVEGAPKLLPACQTPCRDDMVVKTHNERVGDAQRAVHEFLLLNHPIDCPICDQAGECKLQDYYMKYQAQGSRLRDRKLNKPRLEALGPEVMYNAERCIMCTRCVRFMEEVAGDRQLGIFNRGDHAVIGTMPGRELDHGYAMNTVDVCPVGALTSRSFRFKQRVWNLKRSPGVCPGCARGCNMHIDQRAGQIYRLLPRENDAVNQSWMCDAGRRMHEQLNGARLEQPILAGTDGSAIPTKDAMERVLSLLKPIAEAHGRGLAVALAMHRTCEETFAVAQLFRHGFGLERLVLLGYADWEGDELLRVRDRNPNREGIRRIAHDLGIELISAEILREEVESGSTKALVLFGHEFEGVDRLRKVFERLEVLVHFATSCSPLDAVADVVLPMASWAENQGTWVNVDGRAQGLSPAIVGDEARKDGVRWAAELASGLGLSLSQISSIENVRADMERQLDAFKGVGLNAIPPEGSLLSSEGA